MDVHLVRHEMWAGIVECGEAVAQRPHRSRQFVVGLVGVGPQRVTADVGADLHVEDGELRWMGLEGDVAVPFVGDAAGAVVGP